MKGQVADDLPLLKLMLSDLASAPVEYRPTNYWTRYQDETVAYLTNVGLKNFRSAHWTGATGRNVVLSFGGVDLLEKPWRLPRLDHRFPSQWSSRASDAYNGVYHALTRRAYYRQRVAALKQAINFAAKGSGRSPTELTVSEAGNPEDSFWVDGHHYTLASIDYFLRYAWCARFVDFDNLDVIVELGSGSGRQAEIIAKLHQRPALVLVDIPPQLYVAHQYLKAALGDRVVDYRDTMGELRFESGHVYLLGSWRLPEVAANGFDLFWNAASFQEMEPDVVANYLALVGRATDRVYLMEIMAGKERAASPGDPGVLEPTTLEHYRSALGAFELVAIEPAASVMGRVMDDHCDSFWRRRRATDDGRV